MAVYTNIKTDDLICFLNLYEIGNLLSYKSIEEGVENSNFIIYTCKDSYILTIYEKRVKIRDLPFFIKLMKYLSDKGISCPKPISRKDGSFIGNLSNKPASIITFLKGHWIKKPSIVHCNAVGIALANLHLSCINFSMKRRNSLSINNWMKIWKECRYYSNILCDGISKEIDNYLFFLKSFWPKNLPMGIIHADLFPDNVFFLNSQITGIIDFYFACYDSFAYDLAICINSWCFEKDNTFNLEKSRIMISSYCEKRLLNDYEKSCLPILSYGAAMRFFLTRLYDWFKISNIGLANKKNPIEFLHKIRFFAKIKDASELGI